MKQSVFNLNTLKAHPERNAFDLSHNDVFSCAPGMLLPISCTEVLPNEHYEINPQIFLRTMPLNSAAFVRLRQHIEFFFVPMRVLCRQFNQFVVGTKYPISSLSVLNDFNKTLPAIRLNQIRKWYLAASGTDGLHISLKEGSRRLFDLLGYGFSSTRDISESNYPDKYAASSPSTAQDSPALSVLRLACYQKIYQDYYRNPYWEAADASLFNFDDKFGGYFDASVDTVRLNGLFSIRYRNWAKDFFTSVQPSFQGAPFVNRSLDMDQFCLKTDVYNSLGANTMTGNVTTTGKVNNSKSFYYATLESSAIDGKYEIPVHNIRAAFALDKLYRLQQQAGNGSYGEQIRNRFGFGGVHDDWKAIYLGGSSSPISIGEVITTANTQEQGENDSAILGQTGDIYGKASSVNDARIVFDTKEHGIIMGIFSVTPDADYNSFGIDPHNFKLSFEQFYQPEFDRLGHQPLNTYFISATSISSGTNSTNWLQRVIGFQNRYLEYKTGIDRVHGQFCTDGFLSAWSAPRNSGVIFDTAGGLFNLYSLKVSPKIMNSICSVTFDGSDRTDPILVDSHISIKAIRPMSVSDEPLL
nr:MAG TPA: Major capsid protein [Microviridae sp.]